MAAVGQLVGRRAVAEQAVADDAEPRAAQAVAIEKRRVVAPSSRVRVPRRRVGGIGAGERAEQGRGVGDRSRHRPGGVLAVGDGDDPRPAHQAERRLDADERRVARRGHDRSVRFGADGHRAHAGGDGRSRSGARSGRVAVERVRIARLPAAAAPSARRVRGPEVRPLAHVRLAQEHRARGPEARGDERIGGGRSAPERERSGRGQHPIAGGDVVLEQNRHAVQRSAHAPAPPLGVESVGDERRVGIDLEDAAKRRPAPVDRVNPREVLLDERPRALLSRLHAPLQFGDGRLLEIERRGEGSLRPGRHERQGRHRHRRDQSFPLSHDSSFALSVTARAHSRHPIITAAPRNCAMFASR